MITHFTVDTDMVANIPKKKRGAHKSQIEAEIGISEHHQRKAIKCNTQHRP